jgi:hypothetical protein
VSEPGGRAPTNLTTLVRLRCGRAGGRGIRLRWFCPDEERIAAYVDGRLPRPARAKVERHLARCEPCLSQAAFLLRLENSGPPPSVPASVLARARDLPEPVWRRVLALDLRWAALAGATASALLVAAVWLRQPSPIVSPPGPSDAPPAVEASPPPASPEPAAAPAARPSHPRSVRGGGGSPAPVILFPSEGSVVPGKGLEIRWRGVPGALAYEVRLVTTEGSLVWEGQTETTAAPLPADVRLEPARRYYVWVRAHLSEGRTLKSPALGFSVDVHR